MIKFTILGQDLDRHGVAGSLGEEAAHLLSSHDLADGVVLHAVANDHGRAVVQSIQGRAHFGLHPSGASVRLLAELHPLQILRVELAHHPGVHGTGRLVVDAVDVGHEDGEVRMGFHGHPGGQAIVVFDAHDAVLVLILERRWADLKKSKSFRSINHLITFICVKLSL